MKIVAIALNTYREALRNKLLYSVLFFAAFLVGVSALFSSVTLGDQIKVIKDFGLFSLSFFGALATIITGVSLLNKELKQKTIYNVISKPVRRSEFIVGKYLGITLSVGLLVLLMGVGLMIFIAIFEHHFDRHLLIGVLLAVLEVAVVASVSMFFSAIVVTTTLSGLFTLAAYIAGHSIQYLKYFLHQDPQINPALAGLIRVFDLILPDLSLFNMADAIVYGRPIPLQILLSSGIYAITYSTIALILAAAIFSRRELN